MFHIFVVIVGVLILSGAVNTSIIGANGVLNRVAEDGVLLDWFRKPHQQVRHHLPDHQHDRAAADRHHHRQPRRRAAAGRSLRVRRGVEFLHQGAGRPGAAFPAARPGIQVPGELCISAGREIPDRPGRDHADAVLRRHRQPVLETDRHHLRRRLHARSSSRCSPISERINRGAERRRRRDWSSSTWITSRRSTPT